MNNTEPQQARIHSLHLTEAGYTVLVSTIPGIQAGPVDQHTALNLSQQAFDHLLDAAREGELTSDNLRDLPGEEEPVDTMI